MFVRGTQCIPGAVEFIEHLSAAGTPFLILTNNSNPREAGLGIPPEAIFTLTLATAQFLNQQNPHGTTHVIGESGLTTALQPKPHVLTCATQKALIHEVREIRPRIDPEKSPLEQLLAINPYQKGNVLCGTTLLWFHYLHHFQLDPPISGYSRTRSANLSTLPICK